MMKKSVRIISILMTLFCWSCQSKDEAEQMTTLTGTKWKLVGIVDTRTNKLRVVEDFDHYRPPQPQHYTLVFNRIEIDGSGGVNNLLFFITEDCEDKGNAFITHTPSNYYAGCYEFDFDTQSARIYGFGGTKKGEGDELPNLYINAFVYAMVSCAPQIFLKNNSLRLYYNDKKKYLLFKP